MPASSRRTHTPLGLRTSLHVHRTATGPARRGVDLSTLRPGILSVTPQEVAECQAGGLKYDNTDSGVDGSQQRGRDGKGEARIDASNY